MFRRKGPANVASDKSTQTPSKTSTKITTTPANSPIASSTLVSGESENSDGCIIQDRYRLEKTIGKGSYGKVKLGRDLVTGEGVAIKFISRASIKKPAHTVRIQREINLLSALYHPNIIGLHETIQTPKDIILVMEYVKGVDLFDGITGHEGQRYSESEARGLFEQIVAAVEYCHRHNVVHRDLKPENVMVSQVGRVKLIDFGFANMYHPRGFLETNCGSPLYAAPEIVKGVRYVGPEVDIWSLGVILFAILTGSLPFEDENLKGLYAKICAGKYIAPSYLSAGAKDLIKSMLCLDVTKRYTIQQVASHPWLRGFPPLSSMKQSSPFGYSHPKPVIHPDEDIIEQMALYGFGNVNDTREILRLDVESPAAAIYHLLLQKKERLALQDSFVNVNTVASNNTMPQTPIKRNKYPGTDRNWLDYPSNDLTTHIIAPPPPMSMIPAIDDEALLSEYNSNRGDSPSIFSQAAATVANHFKKLRCINILPKSSGTEPV